jgi:hypothetical protein
VSVLRGYLTRQIAASIVLVLTALLMLFISSTSSKMSARRAIV